MPWPLRMITYAGIIVLIILIYFGFRCFRSIKILNLKPEWLYRTLFFLTSGLFLAYPVAGHIQYWTMGTFSRTGFPDPVVYLYWYGVVCMGVMLNWLLLHDLLRLAAFKFFSSPGQGDRIKRRFAGIFLVLAGLTAVYTAGKMVWDTRRIKVKEITCDLTESTGLVEPLTIVHIADLHADNYTGEEKMKRYIRKVNEAGPDIVIFAGDLISSGRDFIETGAEALSEIRSTHGTWFVMGDHDYWVDTGEIAGALESRGINVLQNENAVVTHNGMVIKITGVTEIYSYKVDDAKLDSLLNEQTGETLYILAGHQASERLILKGQASGVHLLLAGHTHGGQIRVPVFFFPVSAARAESRFVSGKWKMGEMLLNINNGLGFTLAPVRYNAPAGVSVIRVQ